MISDEVWRDVPDYEGRYRVSSHGRVLSVARTAPCGSGRTRLVPEKFMAIIRDSYGYCLVNLKKHGQQRMAKVHRLVALAFLPNPDGKPQVNHIDCNKVNNRVENLEWVTAKEHGQHSAANGLRPRGNNSGTAKLTEDDIPTIRLRLAAGETLKRIADDYGVSTYPISCIKSNRYWSHVPG